MHIRIIKAGEDLVFFNLHAFFDEDLGNPQRHLRRLLESSVLPLKGRPGPLDRLDAWLRDKPLAKKLHKALEVIRDEGGEASSAAARALRGTEGGELGDEAVLETLSAIDLADKPAGASYRKDAYARLHLWLELLKKLDGCAGPVVLLDEAENLYRPGVSRPERRTALRSLGFYCGGSLAEACVVLAVTPETLIALREEAGELLDEIEEQRTLLPSEDVAMLRRRLVRAKPLEVQRLTRAELGELAESARKLYVSVRGRTPDQGFESFLKKELQGSPTPRALLRRTMARLERLHFTR